MTTITFSNVYVKSRAAVAGPLEAQGPLKDLYDKTYGGVKEKLLRAKSNSPILSSGDKNCVNNTKYEYWLFEWLSKKKLAVKDSTYIRYRNIVNNHIVPALGKYPISKISTSLMEEFVKKKLEILF